MEDGGRGGCVPLRVEDAAGGRTAVGPSGQDGRV